MTTAVSQALLRTVPLSSLYSIAHLRHTIAEARGKQEDNALRASFQKLLTEGTYYNNATRFNKLNSPISFRSKRDNICGIQIADLCAYPTARHVLQPHGNNRAFSAVQGHFYQVEYVHGLKIFPK